MSRPRSAEELLEQGNKNYLENVLLRSLPQLPVGPLVAAYRLVSERIKVVKGSDLPVRHLIDVQDALSGSLPATIPADIIEEILDRAAEQWSYYPPEQLAELVRVWRKSGGMLPLAMVGVIRRTVLGYQRIGETVLTTVLAELTDLPPVNPGEVWADAVLAQLPDLGADWPPLLGFTPDDPDTARTLGALVETAFRRVPGVGPIRRHPVASAVLCRPGGHRGGRQPWPGTVLRD